MSPCLLDSVFLVSLLALYMFTHTDIVYTVHATPGGSGSQVLIQGNQVKSTVKILEGTYYVFVSIGQFAVM